MINQRIRSYQIHQMNLYKPKCMGQKMTLDVGIELSCQTFLFINGSIMTFISRTLVK